MPLVHVLLLAMQEPPQALPFLQTLQHSLESASKLSADELPSGEAQFVWSSITVEGVEPNQHN
ncbi:MAG: hypothetical protein CMF16_02350 [Idiomarina sp.]|jgi:hypothetical protein|nr:hypothetical protein [Idiomarina sp.]MBF79657.1 hypothetical protein [Idiomarina sp.]|tara:strand:+ start:14965 stop:15153 length:189 start_codon:yes stop_codon:yes gene_type:complete